MQYGDDPYCFTPSVQTVNLSWLLSNVDSCGVNLMGLLRGPIIQTYPTSIGGVLANTITNVIIKVMK